jgi:hypothetical protein
MKNGYGNDLRCWRRISTSVVGGFLRRPKAKATEYGGIAVCLSRDRVLRPVFLEAIPLKALAAARRPDAAVRRLSRFHGIEPAAIIRRGIENCGFSSVFTLCSAQLFRNLTAGELET